MEYEEYIYQEISTCQRTPWLSNRRIKSILFNYRQGYMSHNEGHSLRAAATGVSGWRLVWQALHIDPRRWDECGY